MVIIIMVIIIRPAFLSFPIKQQRQADMMSKMMIIMMIIFMIIIIGPALLSFPIILFVMMIIMVIIIRQATMMNTGIAMMMVILSFKSFCLFLSFIVSA